jgi:hypothetical protein
MRFRADFDTLLHLLEVKLVLEQKFGVFCCENHSFGMIGLSELERKIRIAWVRPPTVAHAAAVCLFLSTHSWDCVMKLHRVLAEINAFMKSPEQSCVRLTHDYG